MADYTPHPNTTSSSSNVQMNANNLLKFVPCQYTFVATKPRENRVYKVDDLDQAQRSIVPRICSLRKNDNTMGIYALVDPMDTNMIASDVCVNLLVEKLSDVSFDDDSYREKIPEIMQNVFYNIETRLLHSIFDNVADKVSLDAASVKSAEKLLPRLSEAESGAFLFAATITQSTVFIAYVGTIRAIFITRDGEQFSIPSNTSHSQYFGSGSIHTIDNEGEQKRLRDLDVDINRMRSMGPDENVRFTRCIGKLSEKLLSSEASAVDINEARCTPLICEPDVSKFKIGSHDFALVMMTNKVYQMFLETGITEDQFSTNFLCLFQDSLKERNPAQHILDRIEHLYQNRNSTSVSNDEDYQELGLLIHFFNHPKQWDSPQITIQSSSKRRVVDGEVTVDEVRNFIKKYKETELKREKNRNTSTTFGHKREKQTHGKPIDPFVRFDGYEKLVNDNEELNQADRFITNLLNTESTSVLEERLNDFLKEHPSLKCD